jgi:hypothetical protein
MVPSSGSGLRVAGFILGGIGLVLGLAGAAVARFIPGLVAAEHARLTALPSPDAPSIRDTRAGTEVIVQGRVTASQPTRFRDFVAYCTVEEERPAKQRERRRRWTVDAPVTPPQDRATPEGTLRVVNADYAIRFPATRWRDPSKVIDTAYSGLVANEAVFVHGRVAGGGLEAIAVGSGTRASYLATVGGNADVAWWLGVGFQIVGGVLLLAGTATLLSSGKGNVARP